MAQELRAAISPCFYENRTFLRTTESVDKKTNLDNLLK